MSEELTDFTFEELPACIVAEILRGWSGDSGMIPDDELVHWTGFCARGVYHGEGAIGHYCLTKNMARDPHFDIGAYLSGRLLSWCQENAENLPIDTPAAPVV
jgi:hypothetical protein